MKQEIAVWLRIFLIPMVPVMAFYWLFESQNYFRLDDAARGIVASGPIAAYVVLVWLGWKLFSGISVLAESHLPALSHLVGGWSTESVSSHGTTYTGEANIRKDRGRISANGHFDHEGTRLGDWESKAAFPYGNRLYILYALTELKDDQHQTLNGVCILDVDDKPTDVLKGSWMVLGREGMSGAITYSRKA